MSIFTNRNGDDDREIAKSSMEKSRECEARGDRVGADAYSELANWCLDDIEKRRAEQPKRGR